MIIQQRSLNTTSRCVWQKPDHIRSDARTCFLVAFSLSRLEPNRSRIDVHAHPPGNRWNCTRPSPKSTTFTSKRIHMMIHDPSSCSMRCWLPLLRTVLLERDQHTD